MAAPSDGIAVSELNLTCFSGTRHENRHFQRQTL
jgi:hypothetical protein